MEESMGESKVVVGAEVEHTGHLFRISSISDKGIATLSELDDPEDFYAFAKTSEIIQKPGSDNYLIWNHDDH